MKRLTNPKGRLNRPDRTSFPVTSVIAIKIAGQGSSASEVESSHSDSQELLYLYPSDIGTLKKEQASSPRVVIALGGRTCTEVGRGNTLSGSFRSEFTANDWWIASSIGRRLGEESFSLDKPIVLGSALP